MVKSLSVFIMRKISDKCCRENQNTRFRFSNFFFFLIGPFIRWKNYLQPDRSQIMIQRTRVALWITKVTSEHSQYAILIAFVLQQWSLERSSVLYYTYISCLVLLLAQIMLTLFSDVKVCKISLLTSRQRGRVVSKGGSVYCPSAMRCCQLKINSEVQWVQMLAVCWHEAEWPCDECGVAVTPPICNQPSPPSNTDLSKSVEIRAVTNF